MEKYEVIGPLEVAGIARGGTVELDPEKVNIEALLIAGHIRPVPGLKPAAAVLQPKKSAGGGK